MTAEKLLSELRADAPARLKWAVCRYLGIRPGSPGWLLMSRRRALAWACHIALDREENGVREERNGGFDLERFLRMREAAR